MNISEQILTNEDKAGNRLYLKVFSNHKGEKMNANLFIKLTGEKNARNMGSYDFRTKTFYCVRKSDRHYHRMTKAYALNWTVLEDPFLAIEKIHMVIDDTEHYVFPKSVVKEYGKFLNFKEQGFELQRFVPLVIIKRYHVSDKNISNELSKGNEPRVNP